MRKHFFRRLLAAVVSLSMLLSMFSQTVLAYDGYDYEALVAELKDYSDEYPDGAFAFYNSQLEASEGDGSLYIDIVRMGGMEGEASVTFKAIDVSAVYGKDYTLSVDEGFFITRELKQDYDAEPIVDLIAETTADAVIGEEQTVPEASENVIEIGVSPEEGIVDVNESFAENADDVALEATDEEPVAEIEPEEEKGLKAAWSASTGKRSSRKSWQEVTGADNAEAADLANEMSENNGYIAEFAQGLPGTEYTLRFDDGEYLKRIKIKLTDDDISETDEQVMFVLMNETGAELAKPNTAYLNITDNDENEQVVFSLPDGAVTVFPEDGYAYINIERISGIEKFASVVVGTGAITAEPGKDYEAGSIEVIFPQGVTSKTVKVPIYDMNRADDVTFAVAIDTESSFADSATSSVAVTIKGDGETSASGEPELSLMSAADEPDETLELFASTEGINTNKTVNSPSSGKDFGSAVTVAPKLDLRNATRIDIEYSTSGSYTYTYQVTEGSGCNKKTVNKTGTRTGKEAKVWIASQTATLPSGGSSVTINLNSKDRKKNQDLLVSARRTEDGHNGSVSYTIKKVTVHYEDIVITVDNSRYDGYNIYTEKVYEAGGTKTANGLTYNDGNQILLGEGRVKGAASYTAKKYSEAVPFSIIAPSANEKTTQDIKPVEGKNVYLAGWQVYNSSRNMYDSEIIKPDSMSLETLYSKYGHKTSFQIRPVIYPYASLVRFNNSYPNSLAYTNNISNGKEINVTMLDTLNITGVGINNSGYAVDSFIINGYYDTNLHGTSGTKRADNSNAIRNYSANQIEDYLNKNTKGTYKVNKTLNSADSSKVILMPDCEAIYLDMTYTQPKIEVMYNPADSAPTENKEDGSVFYFDPENPENSVAGDWQTPMTIMPVNFGSLYNINTSYSDSDEGGPSNYKTVWQDFTGDMNRNGQLTQDEQSLLMQYKLDRNSVTGDVFTYNPRVTNSLIYYYVTERTRARAPGYIDGTVLLKEYPIFGSEDVTYTPVNGAAVTVDGISVATGYDKDFGGIKGTGGDGYFSVADNSFVAGESHRVNIVYGALSTAASQNVNVSQQYILDAYDIISVSNATRAKNGEQFDAGDLMYNDDANYTLTFVTKSSNSALVATKALVKFYRRDGSYVTEKEYSSTGDLTGIFECTFNPKTLGLPAGGKITVTFTDNEGTTYFEHDTGISLMQSLGAVSLVASFSGKAKPVLEVIGTLSSAFDFGWDGNLDDTSGTIGGIANYSISTAEGKKVLNLGLEFAKDGDVDTGGQTKDDVKAAAAADVDTPQGQQAKQAAAQSADNGKNTSKSELAVGFSVEFSFGITLTLAASENAEHKGEWYFEEFMIVVNAGGDLSVSKSFITPIGIPVIVGAGVGADGQAIVVVERRLGSPEYYMADLTSGSGGSVDLINQGQSLSDYMYVYGDFTVAPRISLSAGVGVDMFNIKLNGKAQFKFMFNTKTDDGKGNVNLSCWLTIKILFFDIDFNLGSTNVSLFSEGATLYESLDSFRVSDRAYLANRGDWNGGGGEISLFAVSDMQENELLSGVNPNTDTQLAALDGGKYIAVFVDDVPERTAENSLAVYYSLYDGSSWSEPQIIHDDGTTDDSPVIHDLENGKLFIAWSSANQKFGENPGLLDVLNSRNIQGVFVDKASGALGEIVEVTKDTADDPYADNDVQVAYDADTEKLMIYYTKSEYVASGGEGEAGVYGDAVYPYDVIAYRMYDMAKEQFVDMGDSPEGDWYGQVLLNLAPTVIVNETLDESGYWVDAPEITEYAGDNDPIVIESDAISYNGLSLFAYVLDYDGNKATTTDRDVFMQIYNFSENSVTHPIMITSNDVEERALQFERIGGGITFLSYISGKDVKMFDVSSNISQATVTKEDTTSNGTSYYYLDKSQDSGYIPEMVAIQATGGGDYSGEQEIVDFDIRTGDKYFYVMFTERTTELKDGIEPGSIEAALEENNLVETQIYMTRYDIENGVLTNPVAVTEEEGANYANIAFAVTDDDGGFIAMATKSKSAVEKFEGELFSTEGSGNSGLYSITFTPDANVTAENPTVEGIVAGGAASASFEIYNGGLETIDGLAVEISDADGNAIDVSQSVSKTITLVGGERKEITFSVPVAEEANEAGFTAVVKDAGGNELDTITHSDSVARNLDVISFNAEITERGIIEYNAVVKNNMTVASGAKTFTISAGETELYTANVDSLKPGETKEISGEMAFDYDELFESAQNADGSVSADVVLTATAGNENLTDTLSLFASSEQMARMNAVTDVSFASTGTISLDTGKYFDLATTITADNYNGRYEDNNEEEIAAQGVTVKYMSDNESVAKVYESGYIEGVSNGSATITALLMPADSTYDGVDYVSDYPTFPNEAIKTYTFTVNVGNGSSSRPSSGGGGGTTTYTVKLNTGDGTVESVSVKRNSTIGSIAIPTKEGYEFEGWYTDEALTVKADPAAKITSNTTLYAKWTEKSTDDKTDETVWVNPFEDVDTEDWFYGNVKYAHQNGLMNGTAENLFSPDDDLTRAMLVTILYRAEGEPEFEAASDFTDVADDAYYADAVAWAKENGIVMGISDTEFAPDVQITREQIAAILYRYAGYKGIDAVTMEENLHFDDTNEISEYAISAMNWIVGREIIKGYEDNTVRPQNNATRAEAAAMLQRFIERLEAIAKAEANAEADAETEVTE